VVSLKARVLESYHVRTAEAIGAYAEFMRLRDISKREEQSALEKYLLNPQSASARKEYDEFMNRRGRKPSLLQMIKQLK
jgi:hypothetical protein